MCKVIAFANQKGGVTKSTSTENIGIGLARLGKKVLLIDADGQGSLTASLVNNTSTCIKKALKEWQSVKNKLKKGEISETEYTEWKLTHKWE